MFGKGGAEVGRSKPHWQHLGSVRIHAQADLTDTEKDKVFMLKGFPMEFKSAKMLLLKKFKVAAEVCL